MNKIQSLPVIGEEWKYYFYVDLRFEDADAYHRMMRDIEPLSHDLKVLGEYRQGAKP
jgi:prephenate dehydratase